MKRISDVKEHIRILAQVHCQKTTRAHSVQVDQGDQTNNKRDNETIQKLTAHVQTIQYMFAPLMDQQTAVMQVTPSMTVAIPKYMAILKYTLTLRHSPAKHH